MDRFHFDIVAAADAAHHVTTLRELIQAHEELAATADPWTHPALPKQADLYVLLVVVSPGLANSAEISRKVRQVSSNGFPVIPVVEELNSYSFAEAPLEEITRHNAAELKDHEKLVNSLLHHGGLRLFEGGGKVFISYARLDGTEVANAICDVLRNAGSGPTLDVHAFASGDKIQDDIEDRIREADLVVLVDSKGAAKSEWVDREINMAASNHVPIIAVSPAAGAFRHMIEFPHVVWGPGETVAPAVLREVRRILGRKMAFRSRVTRVLKRLAGLRSWKVVPFGSHWLLRLNPQVVLHVGAVDGHPALADLMKLHEVCSPNEGLLVAGVRPLPLRTLEGLHRAAETTVRVATLPTLAAKVPVRLSKSPLTGKRVFLSASMPDAAEDVALARDNFGPFLVSLTQALFELGATLVFGGHPSVSPFIHECVRSLVTPDSGQIELHQAMMWRPGKATVSEEVQNGPVFKNVQWHGAGADPGEDVAALRDAMITERLDAAVFVGGKTEDYIGKDARNPPGIVDEHRRFRGACPGRPAFVLGLAGGAARQLPVEGPPIFEAIHSTSDHDLAVALIVAELLGL